MAPAAGGVFALAEAFERSAISCFDAPESAHSARSMIIGSTVRTAGSFMQTGPRIFRFQNSGSSKGLSQDLSTRQVNRFLPVTAVSKPWAPSTRMLASFDRAADAAVRARAISAVLSHIYWSRGAMLA